MSDETITNNEVEMEPTNDTTQETTDSSVDLSSPEVKKLMESMVAEQLSQMKENMNKMSKQRDEAMKKAVELEESAKAAKLEKLEAEGKTSEALQMKLDEALARVEALNSVNTTLTRDHTVDKVLGDLQFRNSTAKEMAKAQIIGELKQDAEGSWVHATGAGLSEFVQSFAKDEENAFLFKPKQSTGASAMQAGAADGGTQQKSNKPITEMSFEDYLRDNQGPVSELGF
jgi:NADH dehydrogenase/NADH:ubiquinone oxidoreductase subunit G